MTRFVLYVALVSAACLLQADAAKIVPKAVSVTTACLSVMVGSTHLTCEETTTPVTIVNFLANSGSSSSNKFELSLLSVPPSSTVVQEDTTTMCTKKTAQGRCLAIQQTTLEMEISKPVVIFELEPVGLNFQVPFSYMYKQAFSPSVTTEDCIFVGTSISENDVLMNKIKNSNGLFTCNQPWNATVQLGTPGKSMLVYTMALDVLFQKSVQYAAAFFPVIPHCSVLKARGRGKIVADVTTRLTNEETGETQEVTFTSGEYNQAKTSIQGKVMLRNLGLQSISQFTNPIDYGYWLVCGNASNLGPNIIEPIDMTPAGWNPIDNPWDQLSEEDRSFAVPTPETILKLNGKSTNPVSDSYSRAFFLHINETLAPAYCTGCGCYGVDPDIYSNAPQELYFENYLNIFSDDTAFPCKQLLNVTNINTCVPGFGASFLGLNPPSPCDALNYLLQRNSGNSSVRRDTFIAEGRTTQYLSQWWNSERPNLWMKENRVYIEMPQNNDLQFEYTAYFTGDFAGVINPAGYASATLDQSLTFCGADISASDNSAYISARICNSATSGGPGTFVLYTTCDVDSMLVPQFPARVVTPQPLASGECVTLEQQLIVTGNLVIGGTYTCTIQVASADATPSFAANTSLIMDELRLGCVSGNTSALPMSPISAYTLTGNFTRSENNTGPEVNTTAGYITISIIAAAILGMALLLAIIYIVLRYCM
ncbi:MAG: hypothetical protein JSS82_13915 [Bacteroidetes bacterium]|nr:hypothetical protein [Bacteroidota bacterium]